MLPGMYEIVSTYGLDGSFRGYAIHKEGTMKLHSINLWAEHEHVDLTDTLNRLNNEGPCGNIGPMRAILMFELLWMTRIGSH
jgi:hypothetical protein